MTGGRSPQKNTTPLTPLFEAQARMYRGLVVGFQLSKSSLTSPVLSAVLLSKNSKYSQLSVCYYLAKTRSSSGICLTTRLCSLFFGLDAKKQRKQTKKVKRQLPVQIILLTQFV